MCSFMHGEPVSHRSTHLSSGNPRDHDGNADISVAGSRHCHRIPQLSMRNARHHASIRCGKASMCNISVHHPPVCLRGSRISTGKMQGWNGNAQISTAGARRRTGKPCGLMQSDAGLHAACGGCESVAGPLRPIARPSLQGAAPEAAGGQRGGRISLRRRFRVVSETRTDRHAGAERAAGPSAHPPAAGRAQPPGPWGLQRCCTILSSTPLTNLWLCSAPKRFASSIASLIATRQGTSFDSVSSQAAIHRMAFSIGST